MRKTLFLFFLLFEAAISFGQTINIGGIVNQYSPVTSIDFCSNSVNVGNSSLFSVGQEVLLIQMNGADIDNSNSSGFGDVNDYRDAGKYEICEVLTISGSTITFKYALTRHYDPSIASVQLVSIPQYPSAKIISTLTCPAWDGFTGGVLIIKANNKITFNADIDVSKKGFRGGDTATKPAGYCYNFGIGGLSDYFLPLSAYPDAGMKGEGIFSLDSNYSRARGAAANGGGGGNCHNTGGGGGGNYGAGGQGGERKFASFVSCPGPSPGVGGKEVVYSNAENRIFMGGGGGAGDENNRRCPPAGDGGAIVILITDTIDGPSVNIYSEGEALTDTFDSDGISGGGAGGTVLIKANTFLDSIFIDVSGGKGGDLENIGGGIPDNFCFGPGGGGGGGAIWFSGLSFPSVLSTDLSGGIAGRFTCSCPPACAFSTNGADDGEDGGGLLGLQIPQGTTLFEALNGTACCDTSICAGQNIILSVSGNGTGPIDYQWSHGPTAANIFETPLSTTLYTVIIRDTLDCFITENILVTVINLNINAYSIPDSFITEGESAQLFTDTLSGLSFLWTPSAGLSDINLFNPIATPTSTTTYCAQITDLNGCNDTACVTVIVIDSLIPPPPPIDTSYNLGLPTAFSPNGDGLNDQFIIFLEGIYDEANIRIFNRWGEVVYFGDAINKGWDGKFKNKEQSSGSYPYLLELSSSVSTAEKKIFSGVLDLIR